MTDRDVAVVRTAQAIIDRESWRIHVAEAASRADGYPGLVLAPVFPPSRSVQVVIYDGVHLGTIRLRVLAEPTGWTASTIPGTQIGTYSTAQDAAAALVIHHYAG